VTKKLQKALSLYIYNFDGQLQALIDDYTELIWKISNKPGGSFELVVPHHPSVFTWAIIPTEQTPGNIICADIFDSGNLNFMENTVPMMIESVLETYTSDEKTVTISGRSFDAVLSFRRIIPMISIAMEEGAHGMFPSEILWNLVETTATNPKERPDDGGAEVRDEARYLPNTFFGTEASDEPIDPTNPPWPMGEETAADGPYLSKEYLGDDLYEAVEELCTSWRLGFKVRTSITDSGIKHVFYITSGTDYSDTAENDGKGTIILSSDISYITESSRMRSAAAYKNVVYVKGARRAGNNTNSNPGEIYSARRPGTPSGYMLREGYLDGSSLPANIDDPSFPTENYKMILRMAAADYLYGENGAYVDVVEADIYASYVLGKDYGLGDRISLKDAFGNSGTATVTDIVFTHNDGERSLRPVFEFGNRDIVLYDESGGQI
jgi:hypothetical protein